jgi:hypothetical protein
MIKKEIKKRALEKNIQNQINTWCNDDTNKLKYY